MSTFGWGPIDRETFTMEQPANYVTFNSITNNNQLGDERNFVRVRKKDTGYFKDSIELKKGDICTIQVFYHNNAKSSLNYKGKGFAYDTRVKFFMGDKDENTIGFQAVLTASNANPPSIWDCCLIHKLDSFELQYIPGSLVIDNASGKHTLTSVDLFKQDVLIGIDRMDGIIPGCSEFSGYIELDFKAV